MVGKTDWRCVPSKGIYSWFQVDQDVADDVDDHLDNDGVADDQT